MCIEMHVGYTQPAGLDLNVIKNKLPNDKLILLDFALVIIRLNQFFVSSSTST